MQPRFLLVLIIVIYGPLLFGQQTPPITFSSAGRVTGVQMTGNAIWSYGSDQQTGTVTLQATSLGQGRLALQLNQGTRVETQNPFTDVQRACTWSGFDGVTRTTAAHQCWLSTLWFLPQITLQAGAGAPDQIVATTSSPDGKTIRIHTERHPADVQDDQAAKLLAHLSATDLVVDAATGLVRALRFTDHPDDDAGVDIAAVVRFGDYQNESGVAIPHHIQKFVNDSLVLDLQITGVQVQF